MNKNDSESLRKTKRCIPCRIGIILFLFFILFLIFIDPVLNWTVKEKITEQIKSSAYGRSAQIDDLSYTLFGNYLTFNDVDIVFGNMSKFSEKRVNINSEEVTADGINWFTFIFYDELSLEKFHIKEPQIIIYDSSGVNIPSDTAKQSKSNSLLHMTEIYDSLPGKIRPLNLGSFEISGGDLFRKTISDSSIVIDSIFNLNLLVDKIQITKKPADKNLIIAHDFNLHTDSLIQHNQTSGTRLTLNELNLSSVDSLLSVKEFTYKPTVSTEEYFSRKEYKSELFDIRIENLFIQSFDFSSLIKEKFISIGKISLEDFYLEAITNKRLPDKPDGEPPKMPSQALSETGYKVDINSIIFKNGEVFKKSIHPYFEEPSNIYFTGINAQITDLVSFGNKLCKIDAQGNLQDAAPLEVHLAINLTSPELDLNYYGSMGSLNAEKLNTHVVVEDKTRIDSGQIEEVTFDATVKQDTVYVKVKPIYNDLEITIIDEKDKDRKSIPTFLANTIKLKKNNPSGDEEPKTGQVKYIRKPQDAFLDIVWQALLKGIGDVVGF